LGTNIRLNIDSVIDKDRLRILISTENEIDEMLILDRSNVRHILGIKRLPTRPEGMVFLLTVRDPQRFLQCLREPESLTIDSIALDIQDVKNITNLEQQRLQTLQNLLRQKMKDRGN
jgi:hypothetical protein